MFDNLTRHSQKASPQYLTLFPQANVGQSAPTAVSKFPRLRPKLHTRPKLTQKMIQDKRLAKASGNPARFQSLDCLLHLYLAFPRTHVKSTKFCLANATADIRLEWPKVATRSHRKFVSEKAANSILQTCINPIPQPQLLGETEVNPNPPPLLRYSVCFLLGC